VVLLNNVIEVFTFSDFNAFMVLFVKAFNPSFVGSALIDVNLGRLVMESDCFVQKPQSRPLIVLCSEEKQSSCPLYRPHGKEISILL
jgi:hypothetical protein